MEVCTLLAEMDKSEPEDFSLHSDERKSLQFYFDTGNDAKSEIVQVGREYKKGDIK